MYVPVGKRGLRTGLEGEDGVGEGGVTCVMLAALRGLQPSLRRQLYGLA